MSASRFQGKNWILRALPRAEFQTLAPHLKKFTLKIGHRIQDPQEELDSIYFLESGMVSLVVETLEGRGVEVGLIGCEGLVGYSSLFGQSHRSVTAAKVIQLEAAGQKASLGQIRENRLKLPVLYQLAGGFSQVMLEEISQVAACNRLHFLESRLARWLLMSADRHKDNSLGLTQEFLAQMLGTGRPEVSETLSRLKETGALEHGRGRIRILDRRKLERITCECYAVIRRIFEDWSNQLKRIRQ